MDNCIFCKIVKGEIPCFKIYEDDKFLAFLDIHPLVEGHTLIIPKEHFRYVWDVKYIGEYMECIQKIAKHYKGLGYKNVDSFIMGKDVPHAHIHILPYNDEENNWSTTINEISKKQMNLNVLSSEQGILVSEKLYIKHSVRNK